MDWRSHVESPNIRSLCRTGQRLILALLCLLCFTASAHAIYTYDLAGNRLTFTNIVGTTTNNTTYTYDDLNRLLTNLVVASGSASTNTYAYDLNGNRTNKTAAAVASFYSYDVLNRLVSAAQGTSTVFSATYDYRTRRLTKTEGATATYFRYDGGDSFQEVTGGTNVTIGSEIVRGSGMGGGIGSILYRITNPSLTNSVLEYFTYNAVGHTMALTDLTGAVTKSDAYEAFGNIVASSGSSSNNRLANTKERDASLGLDNHGFRYFDPEIGRYVTRDPIGYGDGFNIYLYVHNNPISHIDPLGLDDASIMEGVGRGLVNAFRVAKGMTFDAGEQTTLAIMDMFESDPSSHRAAMTQVYDGMLNENASGAKIGLESALMLSGYRYGNKIYEDYQAGDVDALSEDAMNLGVMLLGPKGGQKGRGKLQAEKPSAPSLESAPEVGPCFAAGTEVATPKGLVKIEDIRVGDLVYSFDFAQQQVSVREVLSTPRNFTYYWVDVTVEDEVIQATRFHRFWIESEQRWIVSVR